MTEKPKKRKWERQHIDRIDATPEQLARAIVTPLKPQTPHYARQNTAQAATRWQLERIIPKDFAPGREGFV